MPKSPIKTATTSNSSPNKKIVDNTEVVSRLTSELVANPDILAAYGRTLDSLVQHESGFIQYLPRCVKRRLKALKKIQKELFKIEEEFYLQVHCLESKYAVLKEPIHKKRKEIIIALREPTEEEYDYISDEDDEEVTKRIALSNKAMGDNEKNTEKLTTSIFTEKTLGIPDFWLTIFRNVSLLNDLIQKQDIAVLSKLINVRVEYFNRNEDVGFDLIFEFGENDYFEEKELKKSFKLRLGPDPEDKMGYEGPEIVASIETPIKWKKNVTVKNKRIKRGGKRYVNKTVKTDSFFNFFSSKKNSNNSESLDDEIIGDFEVGQVLKDNIIPRAFLYYTGIAFKDDEDEEEEEDDESSDEEDDSKKDSANDENSTQNNAKSDDEDSSDE